MPLEPHIFLSQDAHRPCSDAGVPSADEDPAAPLGLPLPWELRRNYLPTIELSKRLSHLIAGSIGLTERLPDLIWRTPPGPLPACRVLDDLIDDLQEIEERANAARMTCLFRWEIASAEAERLREEEVSDGSASDPRDVGGRPAAG